MLSLTLFCPVATPSGVSCGNPGDVSNSVREGQGHHFRDMVKYTCDIGYEIVGQPNIASRSLTCQFDGNWSLPMPECHRVTCGGIILTSNVVVASEDGVHYGDSVTLECQTGYLYNSGSLMRHCREDKRWNGTSPTCTPVKCGAPPSAPDVKVAGDRFYFPFSVFYSCETGYEVVPSDSPSTSNGLTCSKDGNWEGAGLPACQKVACKPPQRIRSASLVSPAPGDGVYLFGDSVTYACDVGHRWNPASGALARNCTGTKSWSGDPPACERVSCGDPGDVEGAQRLAQGFLYTDKANYSCRLGYENPSGHTWGIISCGADGNWTGQTPNCQRVCCGDPGLGNHSTRIGQDFCFTAQVHYQCHAGFRVPDGLYILQCGGDKRWSSPTPHCEESPGFNETESVGGIGPPAESEESDIIGKGCIILLSLEFGIIVVLDLLTIWKDLRVGLKNVRRGILRMRKLIEAKQRQSRIKRLLETRPITLSKADATKGKVASSAH
nr:complement receptor-like protein [Arenicola marina]